jgi:excisionase family DNA binding protein
VKPDDASSGDEAPCPVEADPSGTPAVLTVDELAAFLRVDRKTVYTALNSGEIPGARRIGRTIRVSRDAVLRWLADGQGRVPHSRRKR